MLSGKVWEAWERSLLVESGGEGVDQRGEGPMCRDGLVGNGGREWEAVGWQRAGAISCEEGEGLDVKPKRLDAKGQSGMLRAKVGC